MTPELARALPSKGYLANYVEYAGENTMSPTEFNLAAGLCQMSAFLGNRIVFPLGGQLHPAHLWVVLLGRAGIKKSTAANLALGLVDEISEGKMRLPSRFSPEALLDALRVKPAGYINLGEFMAFLKAANRGYMEGIKEDLCDIFDSPGAMVRKLKSGEAQIRKPALTVLASGVTSSVGEWVKAGDLEGGFLSRFLFVPQTSDVEYRPMKEQDPRRDYLLAELSRTARSLPPMPQNGSLPPIVALSGEAHEVFTDYDKGVFEETREGGAAELSGFHNRVGLYTAKLSFCYALAMGRTTPEAEDVQHAAFFTEYTRRSVERLAQEDFAIGNQGREIRKVKQVIERLGQGWVLRREALRRSHLSSYIFDRVTDTLKDRGELEERSERGGTGQTRRYFRLVTPDVTRA